MTNTMRRLFFALLTMLMVGHVMAQDTLVTVPEDAEQEDWTLTCNEVDPNDKVTAATYPAKIAIQGSDIYIQGLAFDGAWVKGTIAEGTVTIPARQFVGNYGNTPLYLIGYKGEGAIDIEFSYDAEKGLMSTDAYIVLIDGSNNVFGQMRDVSLRKGTAPTEENSWTLTGKNVNPYNESQYETINETIQVNIDGTDITIQGLSAFDPAATISGTISGTTATFTKYQPAGSYNSQQLYFIGFAGQGDTDIVFSYDEAKGLLVAENYILVVTDDGNVYEELTDVVISKGGSTPGPAEDEDPVALPEGLTAHDYLFTAKNVIYTSEGAIDHMEDVQWPVKVAFSENDEAYVRGLCQMLPGAWARGNVSKDFWDVGTLTFPQGQFLGKGISSVYLCGMKSNAMTDYILDLGDQNSTLTGKSFMIINSSKTQLAPYFVYAGTKMTKMTPKAATPLAPTIERYQPFMTDEGYAVLMLTVPALDTDNKVLAPGCLGYRLYTEKDGQQQLYTFTQAKYTDLPQTEATVIPYDLATGYNFYLGGSLVFLNDNLEDCDRLGVQSVYTVGTDERASQITWMSFGDIDGITPTEKQLKVVSETFCDLQGRPVSASARGLLVKTQRLADGSVRSTKVIR